MPKNPHPTLPRPKRPEPPSGTPEHEEWLMDEAGDESFPASDPAATSQPGNTLTVNKIADEGRKTVATEEQLRDQKKK